MTSAIKYDHPDGFDPTSGYPWSADRQLLSWVPPNSHVLELGCATGYMGRYLRDKKNCRAVGVDAHAASLEKARDAYERVILADLDHPETLNVGAELFDVILCAAVLEHVKDPHRLLVALKSKLKPGGIFLISLPNIAHWSVRLNLLAGRFDYSDYGLLDSTHLRFFTYQSSQKFLTQAGLKLQRISIDPDAGLPILNGAIRRLPGGWGFLRWVYECRPNFFAYQILFEARPA